MAQHTYQYFNVGFPQEYVAHVEVNRPERLNAFIEAMWLELRGIFDHLSTDPSTRAVVLSGAGPKAFTAGIDIQQLAQDGVLADPVICVLHGYTYGLGIDLCVCADIRLCASTTKFAVKEVDLGLAADVGTLSRLPRCVGSSSWVKDVCLTARTFDADEAHHVGFVSGVFESKDGAIEEGLRLAGLISSKSPVAVQGTKELLNHSRDHSVQDSLRFTALWNSAALQTRDLQHAMKGAVAVKQNKAGTRPRYEKL
ncbi:MAG: hypothetical protein M1815_005145 [Lichina confinis]|nr:MAG: hypothetical protein M1815_005145 [Lichina confinis]